MGHYFSNDDLERNITKRLDPIATTRESLPSISDARLPENYASTVIAITKASRIAECQNWSDKAMALA
jgi:hypothetical protein